MEPSRVLFPTGKGGGEGVGYGYKGKGILIHSVTDANGMPVVAFPTAANGEPVAYNRACVGKRTGGDQRQQVLPLLAQIRPATGKPGNPKRRPKTLAVDKGYDAGWERSLTPC